MHKVYQNFTKFHQVILPFLIFSADIQTFRFKLLTTLNVVKCSDQQNIAKHHSKSPAKEGCVVKWLGKMGNLDSQSPSLAV